MPTLLAFVVTLLVASTPANADGPTTAHEGDKVAPFEVRGDVRALP